MNYKLYLFRCTFLLNWRFRPTIVPPSDSTVDKYAPEKLICHVTNRFGTLQTTVNAYRTESYLQNLLDTNCRWIGNDILQIQIVAIMYP